MIIIVGGFVSIFVPQIVAQAKNLTAIDVSHVSKNLEEPLANITAFVQKYQVSDTPALKANELIQERLQSIFSVTRITDFFSSFIGL